MTTQDQLYFEFAPRCDFNADEFIVHDSNQEAYELVQSWPRWQYGIYPNIVYVRGEEGSGKTYLAHLWEQKANAIFLTKESLKDKSYMAQESHYVIDSIEDFLEDESALFGFINHMIFSKNSLLITGKQNLKTLQISLRDLSSRLGSVFTINICPPDMDALEQILLKYFSDKQIIVSSQVVKHLSRISNRSYKDIQELVVHLDGLSIASNKKISLKLVQNMTKI